MHGLGMGMDAGIWLAVYFVRVFVQHIINAGQMNLFNTPILPGTTGYSGNESQRGRGMKQLK
jgi:hypothetical protein